MVTSPVRSHVWVKTASAAFIALAAACASAQTSGNTTRVRPGSTTVRVDSTKPAPGAPGTMQGAGAASDTAERTTAMGVYSADQAARGKDIYLTNCVSCHTPADHTGGGFWTDLLGKKVDEFFKYLRENMPQDNPGAISDDDYAAVVAYTLQLNGQPAGDKPLPADTTQLHRIRITPQDTTRKGP
jgi:mono/diheme cytochrome c family protein